MSGNDTHGYVYRIFSSVRVFSRGKNRKSKIVQYQEEKKWQHRKK